MESRPGELVASYSRPTAASRSRSGSISRPASLNSGGFGGGSTSSLISTGSPNLSSTGASNSNSTSGYSDIGSRYTATYSTGVSRPSAFNPAADAAAMNIIRHARQLVNPSSGSSRVSLERLGGSGAIATPSAASILKSPISTLLNASRASTTVARPPSSGASGPASGTSSGADSRSSLGSDVTTSQAGMPSGMPSSSYETMSSSDSSASFHSQHLPNYTSVAPSELSPSASPSLVPQNQHSSIARSREPSAPSTPLNLTRPPSRSLLPEKRADTGLPLVSTAPSMVLAPKLGMATTSGETNIQPAIMGRPGSRQVSTTQESRATPLYSTSTRIYPRLESASTISESTLSSDQSSMLTASRVSSTATTVASTSSHTSSSSVSSPAFGSSSAPNSSSLTSSPAPQSLTSTVSSHNSLYGIPSSPARQSFYYSSTPVNRYSSSRGGGNQAPPRVDSPESTVQRQTDEAEDEASPFLSSFLRATGVASSHDPGLNQKPPGKDEKNEEKHHGFEPDSNAMSAPSTPRISSIQLSPVAQRAAVGFRNLGNTCFMNSALQSFLSTPGLIASFPGEGELTAKFPNLSAPEKSTYSPYSGVISVYGSYSPNRFGTTYGLRSPTIAPSNQTASTRGRLAYELSKFIRNLKVVHGSVSSSHVLSPDQLRAAFVRQNTMFDNFSQHDAQEFLVSFISQLHEDLNDLKEKPKYVQLEGDDMRMSDRQMSQEWWSNFTVRNNSLLSSLFAGQFRSLTICPSCRHVSRCFDPFWDLSLAFPAGAARAASSGYGSSSYSYGYYSYGSANSVSRPNSTPVQLTALLTLFGKREELESKGYHCPKCKYSAESGRLGPFMRELGIYMPPANLMIQLKRFSVSSSSSYLGGYSRLSSFDFARKIETPVAFPIQLDLTPYVVTPDNWRSSDGGMAQGSSSEERLLYRLYAVVMHSGSSGGGHYTAYGHVHAGSASGPSWYLFDDSYSHRVEESEVLASTSKAYLLFYTRINSSAAGQSAL